MSMQVFSGRVHGGKIVLEDGLSLPEGAVVTIVADADGDSGELTPEEESALLEAIAGCERGETVTAAELFERLRR